MKHIDTEFQNTKLPFGMYKGLIISKVRDLKYLEWYIKNFEGKTLRPDIRYAIETRIRTLKEN